MKIKFPLKHPADEDPEGWSRACADADKILEPLDKKLSKLINQAKRLNPIANFAHKQKAKDENP